MRIGSVMNIEHSVYNLIIAICKGIFSNIVQKKGKIYFL